MKAISIRQPWAHAICHMGKRIENRDWRHAPTYRGPILIHAAKNCTGVEFREAGAWMRARGLVTAENNAKFGAMPRGAIVARARLVDARRIVDSAAHAEIVGPDGSVHYRRPLGDPAIEEAKEAVGYHVVWRAADPWAIPGQLGLVIDDVELFSDPIPWKGALGLFEVPESAIAGVP